MFEFVDREKTSIAEVYPQLSPDERKEAEENLRRYLGVVQEIFQHIQANDPKTLTELRRRARLRREKSRE